MSLSPRKSIYKNINIITVIISKIICLQSSPQVRDKMAKREGPNLERLFRFSIQQRGKKKSQKKATSGLGWWMMSVIPPQTEPWFWEKQLNKRCLPRRQNATRPPQRARIMGDRLVKEKSGIFFFKSFWRPCGATAHLRGATRRRPIPKAAKFWWDSKLSPVGLTPWICSYFSQFYFLLFWPRQSFSYYFDLGKWCSEKSRGWNRCARAFHCLESWNILKMAFFYFSLQVLSSLHFWIIKFILHIQIFRPTGLFKNFYTRTLRYWWLMLMLQFAFF